MGTRQSWIVPDRLEALARRELMAGNVLTLQGAIGGYVQEIQPATAADAYAPSTDYFHVLGQVRGLGSMAYGGGFGRSTLADGTTRMFQLTGSGGVVALSATVEGLKFGGNTYHIPEGYGDFEEVYYTILGGTGSYVGDRGNGTAILTYGNEITPPAPASGPSVAGEVDYAFTLNFLQVAILSGAAGGTTTGPSVLADDPVYSEEEYQPVGTPETLSGGAAAVLSSTDPASNGLTFGTLVGSLTAALNVFETDVVGTLVLADASGTIDLNIQVAVTSGQEGLGSYQISGGTDAFSGLIGAGEITLSDTKTALGTGRYTFAFNPT